MNGGDHLALVDNEFALDDSPVAETRILVAVSGSGSGERVVNLGARLAKAMGASWHAVFIETPQSARDPAVARRAAVALSLAARQGATVSNESAGDVATGLTAHLSAMPAAHLVVGTPAPTPRRRWFQRSTLAAVLRQLPALTVHIAPAGGAAAPEHVDTDQLVKVKANPRHHLFALGPVAITLCLAEPISLLLGGRPLNLWQLYSLQTRGLFP